MAQILAKKLTDPQVFGVIELDEGVGYYVAEFESVPVDPHLPYSYDSFADDDTIESLSAKYKIDLSNYVLVPA